jgi:prepilin-type N-terminal cleavage/methylation domain-containing protein
MATRGFTIVELIITITIMGILLLLTVVSITSSQVAARDDERISDVESIQSALENFYAVGTSSFTTVGQYPPVSITNSTTISQSFFPDINLKSLMAPGVTDTTLTFIPATNNNQTVGGVIPQPTVSQYVYQPITSDGTLCVAGNTDCRKYNLFYRLEKNNAVYMVTSKNQ